MKIIFFDLETTGLPLSWKEKYTNKSNWPYIVQLAYIISYEDNEISEEQDYILKPEGFKIPEKSTNIHGISNELAIKKGNSRKEILHLFAAQIRSCDYVVAHNADFDINVLRCEFLRNNIEDPFKEDLNIICTMKKSIDFCKISSAYGNYKWPSLQELYSKLFKKYFNDAHNAKNDVRATFDCFWKLSELNVITFKNEVAKYQPNIDKKFLYSFFIERDDIFYDLLSNYYPLDEDLLTLLEPNLDWYAVSRNTKINWTIDLIEEFQDYWDMDAEYEGYYLGEVKWYGLSSNPSLPWSVELIQMFKDKFAFNYPGYPNSLGLSSNEALPWSYGLINAFLDDWDWSALSSSSFLAWDVWLIEKFKDKWYWGTLSSNESLPWSQILIAKYIDKWDWEILSYNEKLPWSMFFIAKYQDYWEWPTINKMIIDGKIDISIKDVMEAYFTDNIKIQYMAYLPLSEQFLDLAIDSWKFNWESFGYYGIIPWSAKIIEKFRPKIGLYTLEYNRNLYWTIDILRKFEDTLAWRHFANSKNHDWSIDFLIEFEHRINFDETHIVSHQMDWFEIKKNKSILWNELLLERYYEKLKNDSDFWKNLSQNKLEANWTPKLIDKYLDHWDWRGLSSNESLCWSDELIKKYENYWSWINLSLNSEIKCSDITLEYYINRFNTNDFDFFYEAHLYPGYSSQIISHLLERHSNQKFIFEFLKANSDIKYPLDKLWEWSKAEINKDFITHVNTAIDNENSGKTYN